MTCSGQLRLGLVGSGFAARTVAASAASRADVVVAGVTGGSRAAELAGVTGAAHYPGLPEMLPHVDAVVVASPHDSHADYCRAALAADRHVFCEKPFVLDAAVGAELAELARSRGLVLSVNQFQRYRTPNAAAAEHLRDSASAVLGGHCRLIESPMTKSWQLSAANSGFLYGYGVHAIDLLCWWLSDRVESVRARATFDAAGVEHTTVATLRFAGGAQVQLLTSDEGTPLSQVGRAVFETLLVTREGILEVDSYGSALVTSHGVRTHVASLSTWDGFTAPERLAAYSAALSQFVRASVDGAPLEITPDEVVHGLRVCEAVLTSARNGGVDVCV